MDDVYLQRTLDLLGVGDIKITEHEVISSSEPDRVKNAAVYDKCNDIMLTKLHARSVGPMMHVTGEMRALSDPLHRQVCRESARRYGTPAKICAYLPKLNRATGLEIWKWNHANWPSTTGWKDHLDVFHLLASGETVLFALEEMEEMHFSIFGSSHVLLQEKHDHDTHTKRVWLIESQALRNALAPTVERCFQRAVEVSSRTFAGFAGLLSDALHLEILFASRAGDRISEDRQVELSNAWGTSFAVAIDDLRTVDFLEGEGDCYRLTKDGGEFLSLLE